VRGEAHLIALALHHPVTLESGQELGEDLFLSVSGPAPELLPGDPAPQRVLGVESLEERHGLGAETVARLMVDVPFSVHGRDRLGLLELVEQAPEALRAEGHAGAKIGGAEPRRSRLAQVLLDHFSTPGPSREAGGARRRAAHALESGRRDVQHSAAPDGDEGE